MAKLMFFGTHGPEDPTRATFVFLGAKTARAENIDTIVFLGLDGTLLMKDAIAEGITSVGFGTLKEHLKAVIDAKIPIYV